MTWSNLSRPGTQTILTASYSRIAEQLGALLAPVGLAWAKAQNLSADLILHHEAGRHASPTGAYLTDCVYYSVLFNTSPEGLPARFFIEGKMRPDQDEAQAILLQKVAWGTVLNWESLNEKEFCLIL